MNFEPQPLSLAPNTFSSIPVDPKGFPLTGIQLDASGNPITVPPVDVAPTEPIDVTVVPVPLQPLPVSTETQNTTSSTTTSATETGNTTTVFPPNGTHIPTPPAPTMLPTETPFVPTTTAVTYVPTTPNVDPTNFPVGPYLPTVTPTTTATGSYVSGTGPYVPNTVPYIPGTGTYIPGTGPYVPATGVYVPGTGPYFPNPIAPVTGNGAPMIPSTYPIAYPTMYPPTSYILPDGTAAGSFVPVPYGRLPVPFAVTPYIFIQEFYCQLCILDEFFLTNKIRYWLTGGTLLGQVREQNFIQWDTNNDIGVLIEKETDGEDLFRLLKTFLQSNKEFETSLAVWRSTHGLKLVSKNLKHAGTDIYFYQKLDDGKIALFRQKSRKQWPNDYFLSHELETIVPLPFGPLRLNVPRDSYRYISTLYGKKAFSHAKLGSYDHFSNGPRMGPKGEFPLF